MENESRPNGLVVRTTGSWYNVLTDGGKTHTVRLLKQSDIFCR